MYNVMVISDYLNLSFDVNPMIVLFNHSSVESSYIELKRTQFDLIILSDEVCKDGIISSLKVLRSIQKAPIWLITRHLDMVTLIATSKLGVTNIFAPFKRDENLKEYILNFFKNLSHKNRVQNNSSSIIVVDNLSFNSEELSVSFLDGTWIPLQPRQASILKHLMLHPNQTVSIESIFQSCFDYSSDYVLGDSELKLLRTQMSILRTTLKRAMVNNLDPSSYIKTEVNRGYKFITPLG